LVNGVRSGNKVETTTYDYLGHFRFNSIPWTNPTEIVITGQYLNENTGDYLLDGNLSAIIRGGSGKIEGSVNVNILTHIVAKKIKKLLSIGKTFDEAYNIANAFLKNKFNLDFLNGKGAETLDLTDASNPDNIKLLQISSALLNTQNPDKVLNDIANDAEDGDIDEVGMAGLDELKDNIDGVNLSEVVSNMNGAGVSVYTVDAVKGILKNKLPVDFNLNFIDRYDVPLSTQINSNEVTLFGFDGNVSIKVENANALVSYSDDSGYHSTSLGTANTMLVGAGTTIKFLTVSSSSYDTIKKATLFVNGKEFYFITKTKSNPNINDTTPNSFNLGTKLNVEPSSDISSNEIEVSGLSDGVFVDINITGGEYSINGVDKGTTPAKVTNHDKVVVKLTTSNQFSHFQKATLTIGGVNGEFKTVTRAEDKIPAPFSPQTKYNVEPSTNYETDYFTMNDFEGDLDLVVSGGEVQVEGDTQWLSHINSLSRGVRVKFRQTSSSEYDKEKVTTIKLGNLYHTTFTTITKANPALMDYTPRAFNLSKRVSIDEVQNQTVQSDDIPISGIANGTGIKIKPSSPNTMIKINNGNWTNGEISGVMAGDILKIKNIAVNASNKSLISTVSYYDRDDSEYKIFIRFSIRVYDSIQNPDDVDFGTIVDAVVPQSGFTDYYSNEVTISGLSAGSEVEAMVLGPSGYSFFSKNGGTWEHPHKVSLKNGDKIKFKVGISSSVGEGHTDDMFLNFKNKSFKFSITTNIAPIFRNRLSLDNIEVGDHIDFTPSVLDNQVVTFSLQNAPAWLSIDSATGKITGVVQSGSFSNVKLVATDSLGLSSFLPLSFSANVAPNLVGDSFGKEFILDDNSKNPNLFVFDFNISDIDTPLGDLDVNMTHEIVESRLASQGLNHGFTNSSIICDLSGHCGARVAIEFSRNDGLHPSLKTRHYISVSDGDKNITKYVDIWFAPTAPILSGNQNLTISFVGNSAVANFHFAPTNSGNKAQSWTISNKPTWLEFNSTTGEVSTNTHLDSSMVGEYKDINITATNDRGSDSFVFNITVSQTPQQAFEVQDYYGVEINQAYSSFVVVDWLQNGQTAPISISGYAGQSTHTGFRVNGADGVSTVQNGDIVEVWHLSSNSYDDIKKTTLTIGNSSDDFITQTKASSSTKLPLIVGAPNTSANLHERYSYTPQLSTDYTRFAPVTKPFEIQNKPDWADFNSTTGELSGTPTVIGEYKNVKIIAYGDNGIDDITFNITVDATQPPSIMAQSPLNLDNPDMNFTFNDNADWRSKITQIGMFACYSQANPVILNSSDYTISQGKLQLHVSTSSNPILHIPSMGGARLVIQANGYNDDEVYMDFIGDGQYARKATITSDTQIKEHNISSVTVHLVLENGLEFRDNNLNPIHFFLIGGPNGLSINTITYIDSTHADLTLRYYGNDFDTNISFSIKINELELKNSECLSDGITSNAIPIIADVETPFVQVLYPDDPVADDQFGYSVSDKNGIIAVGANSGVYIYKKVDGNYTQIQKITPPDPSNTAYFGEVVALDGDYLVIGSGKYNNNNKPMAGIVYIYKKGVGGFYGYITSLTPPDLNEYDHFGSSVDISNNMIIVGAYNALREPDRGGRGKAYLYKNDGSDNFALVETITRSNGKPFDGFGYDVSITNDAVETDKYYIIIGSYVHPDYVIQTDTTDLKPELGAGFANYYRYINNTLSNPIILTPTDSTNLADLFGSNVSINNYTIAVGSENGIYFYQRAFDTVGEDGKISTGIGPNFNNLEAMFYFNRKLVVGGSKSYVFSDNGIDYDEYNTVSVGNNIGYSASIDNFEVARGMYSNSDLVTNGGAVLVTNVYENITSLPNANASTSPNLTVSSDRSLDNSCLSFTFTQDTNWQNAISKIMYKAGETNQYVELSEGSDYEFTSNTSLCIKLSSSSKVALHTPYLTQGSLLIKATGYLDSVTSIDGVGAGNNAIKATITANPSLKEDNLDGADIDLTLENTLQFDDNSLDKNNFSLLSAPNGVTISSVSYTDATHATVTLAFNHTDFDDNSSLSISISENELNSGYAQTTNSLNVEAITEAQVTTSGKVVDPYIENARFWYDANGDGVQDNDELSTYSDKNGSFAFSREVPESALIKMVDKGLHNGKSFQGDLIAEYNSTLGGFISPITSMVAKSFTPSEIVTILTDNGLSSDLNSSELFLDPFDTSLLPLDGNMSSFSDTQLAKFRRVLIANVAINSVLSSMDAYGLDKNSIEDILSTVYFLPAGEMEDGQEFSSTLLAFLISNMQVVLTNENLRSSNARARSRIAVAVVDFIVQNIEDSIADYGDDSGVAYLLSNIQEEIVKLISPLINSYTKALQSGIIDPKIELVKVDNIFRPMLMINEKDLGKGADISLIYNDGSDDINITFKTANNDFEVDRLNYGSWSVQGLNVLANNSIYKFLGNKIVVDGTTYDLKDVYYNGKNFHITLPQFISSNVVDKQRYVDTNTTFIFTLSKPIPDEVLASSDYLSCSLNAGWNGSENISISTTNNTITVTSQSLLRRNQNYHINCTIYYGDETSYSQNIGFTSEVANIPIVKTMQQHSYDENGNLADCNFSIKDDHYYNRGYKPNREVYINNSQIVVDTTTKLMFEDNSSNTDTYNRASASLSCESLTLGGFTDWRLPTVNELMSLARFDGDTLIDGFSNITSTTANVMNSHNGYWTNERSLVSSTFNSSEYLFVTLPKIIYNVGEGFEKRRLCVRSYEENTTILPDLVKTGDIVVDAKNSLEWSDNSETDTDRTWRDAIDYCESLVLDNKDDWRLPNINELMRTAGHNKDISNGRETSLNTIFTSTNYYAYFWSSTTNPDAHDEAYYLDGGYGKFNSHSKTTTHKVRCVRGGYDGGVPKMIHSTLEDGATNISIDAYAHISLDRDLPDELKSKIHCSLKNLSDPNTPLNITYSFGTDFFDVNSVDNFLSNTTYNLCCSIYGDSGAEHGSWTFTTADE